MCDGLIFQGHQLKQLGEKLPVIVEVNEQEILNEGMVDDQTREKSKENKDPFEDFTKGIQAQSTSLHLETKKELPKCKDYCYMWKLVSEITGLKWQINLKDELLIQQLKIIKVLATRLFVMETCFKKMEKMPEEIVPNHQRDKYQDIQSEKEIKNHSMSKESEERTSQESTDRKNEDEQVEEVLKPPEAPSVPSSMPPSQRLSFQSEQTEDDSQQSSPKHKATSKVSSKSVHLFLDNGLNASQVVEPEKDLTIASDFPKAPSKENLPVVGTQDSLELMGKTPQGSEKKLRDKDSNGCICEDKDYWGELGKLEEENKMLREGSEIQRLKKEVEEKMKRILELNEENRTLNDMINMLRTNQTGKKQIDPPSDSEPMSSDSDYCTGGRESSRAPTKPSSAKRKVTCREKCGYQYRDAPDPMAGKLCVCREDSEKGNESPPFIDVYKREDKGKFISDSSSTVCNEEVCAYVKNFTLGDNQQRARGGNDSNNPCPAGTFPNFQYSEVCTECDDSNCPFKDDIPMAAAIDTAAVTCGANEISFICGNKSCQTEICDEYQCDLGAPIAQCDVGSCLNPTCEEEERVIGVDDYSLECDDRTCPKKDFYEPGTVTTDQPAAKASFPITCKDETCQSVECSAKVGDELPLTQSYAADRFPITCDDTTCLVPDCSARTGGIFPSEPCEPPIGYPPECVCANGVPNPNCPCMTTKIQPAFAPEGVSKVPSICICGMPDECLAESSPSGKPIDQQASSFAHPRIVDGRCSRGVCATCVCMPFPSGDGQPRAGVPPPSFLYGTQSKSGGGGRCPRGICDACACIVFPGAAEGGSPRRIEESSAAPAYGGTQSPAAMGPDMCAICGCQLTSSDIMKGQTCDAEVSVKPPTYAATGVQVMDQKEPKAAIGPLASDPCPDEVCQEPCSCKVVPSEPYFDPDEPRPARAYAPAAGVSYEVKSGPGEPPSGGGVGPVSEDLCPDDICEKPCTCKVVPSEPYIDSDMDLRKRQHPTGTAMSEKASAAISEKPSAAISEKPSAAISEKPSAAMSEKPSEVCSAVCQAATENASLQITDKASVACSAICSEAVGEKPSASMAEKPSEVCSVVCQEAIVTPAVTTTDGVCGDSTCAKRYPKVPTSTGVSRSGPQPRPPPPGGDDRTVIRCICKSKFCKVIPDPDNPNQRLCVDASDTNMGRRGSSCVCEPSCPKANPENLDNMGGGGCEDSPNDGNQTSQYPNKAPVMTVNQLYMMPKTPESLSKEQEYAGLSRKDSLTRRTGYIAPRKAHSRFGIPDDDDDGTVGNEEMKNADLKLVIADLKSKLLDAEDKIEDLKIGKNYNDKDNDTALIQKYSEEINEMKKSLKWTKKEKEEYEYLKQRVKLLEQGKGDTDNITSNLQTAVDLYVDTIELLEASEQKLKAEIEQYKGLNEVLHENILSMREEIESMKKTFQQELDDQKWINFVSHIDNVDVQHTNEIYSEQITKYQNFYQQMMELNYELEMEHVNNLQDLSMMEAQFHKYQSICKMQEEEKIVIRNQLKKLTKKNKCYEEVVQFFKGEMSVMSDELLTLQEVLNVTNVSSQEENNKLIGAILQLRRINDRLVAHLCAIEKQAILENQINQINEARINELQNIISAKNNDLTQHDDIIQDMRRKLNNATRQNADLKKTIKNLTDTVVEIQEGIKCVEREQMKNLNDVSVVESRVCLASGDLESIKTCMEQKNSRIIELENQLKSQEVDLILANKELGMLKGKKADSKEYINSLKEQLSLSEKKNEQIIGDYQMVVKKLQDYTSLEHMKNYELNHYKSLVEEMKLSLGQLNNGLEKCEASNIHFYEDLRNSDQIHGRLQHRKNNLPIVFDELKKSMADLKRRLSDADFKGGLIEEELLKVKESHMSQIPEEVTDTQKELEAKIISSIEEQSRLNQQVEEQKDVIDRLKRELEKEKADACCCKRSVSELKNEKTTSNAEMEISQLKCELNKSLHRQRLLNEENDQIHTQMINLRKKLTILEQAYDVLKQENEEYKMQLKRTSREKEYLAHKNHDLTKTIEQMRSTHDQLEKQCRYKGDCLRNLELELAEAQAEKETVCNEAKNLASVVKSWFQEQQVVNGEIRGKFKSYSDTIASLRQTMMMKMSEEKSWIKTPMQQPFSPRRYGTVARLERRTASPTRTRKLERHTADARYRSSSPWRDMNAYMNDEYLAEETNSHRSNIVRNISYDSNSSPYTSRSPSPRSTSIQGEEDELDEMNLNDWFSPNYKETETDGDEGEEDTFINKVQLMTAQVQEANKRWQKKMNKEHLSKSRASNK